MNSCGVIVEYNPFHNGHAYHIQEAKKISGANVLIAVMSGNFLQRGEPAIIDKFHRAKAALLSGIDLVIELPYAFAVQNSDYFAKGAVHSLHKIGVKSICFGSEAGNAKQFINAYQQYKRMESSYKKELKYWLNEGLAFPDASARAYREIGLTGEEMDLSQPNNILGLGYVKAILDYDLPLEIHTIKRLQSGYHDQKITNSIASATSIRKEMLANDDLTQNVEMAIPVQTKEQLLEYKLKSGIWHDWEKYFHLVNYRISTMSVEDLQKIHGVDEGLEFRLKETAKAATSMENWIDSVKTKRYTRTRIQRMFTHILTNTLKSELEEYLNEEIPYVRILGMNKRGQKYLNYMKKDLDIQIITGFKRNMHPLLQIEERASLAYYSVLKPMNRRQLMQQEIKAPLRIN